MNKLKKFLIATVSFVVVLYCLFFVLVYAFGDLNKYVPQLQQIVKDSVGLDINVKSAKVVPTAKVELNLIIDDLTLKYPNKKDIASIDDFSLKVPVLPIIAGDIKLSEIPKVSLRKTLTEFYCQFIRKS